MALRPRQCAVIGDPIAHSLSPVLHRAGYDALGLDFSYDAVQVPSGGLADFMAGLGPEWAGVSVTAPLKREALEFARSVSPGAELAGGANTLVRDGERWASHNTDLPGAVAAIRERYDGPVRSGVVLGAGATAASTGLALVELGARRIRIAARDADRARATIASVGAAAENLDVEFVDLATYEPDGEEIVVSTIPASAQGAELVARFADVAVLFDVIYHPWPTPLAAAAGRAGGPGHLVSGLDLLVHQAVLQFEMFTGQPGPLTAMRAAGERALLAR